MKGFCLYMLTMDRKLKAESKIKLRMDQLEGRVGKVRRSCNSWFLKLLKPMNFL